MKRKEREVACCHGNQGKTKLLCSLLKEPYYMVSSIHSSTEHIVWYRLIILRSKGGFFYECFHVPYNGPKENPQTETLDFNVNIHVLKLSVCTRF